MPINPVLSIDGSKVREDGNHLSWVSGTADDGSALTLVDQYLLFSDESTASASFVKVSVEGTLHTLSSLTDGVTYLVKLAQETSEAGILFSNTLSLLATSKPTAPIISSIIGKDNGLQIAISHSSDGGSAMSKITFLLADGSDIFTVVRNLSYVSGQAAPSSFLLETSDNAAIVNEKTFEIACYTTNARGDSPLSVAQIGIPSNYPDAPRDLGVVVGDQQAVLSFKHPLDFAAYSDHTTLNYEVQYRATGASEWISIIDAISSLGNSFPISLTLSDLALTNGYIYEFKIRYINEFGIGVFTSVVSGMSYQLASAPVITDAIPGNAEIVVLWSPPSSLGGGVLSKYEVRLDGALSATVNAGSPTTATISSLTNGTSYNISIQAFTDVDGAEYGGAIASQDGLIPFTVPDVPANFQAFATDGGVSLSWDKPADNGRDISQYQVRKYVVDHLDQNINAEIFIASQASYIASGLENGTKYRFQVRARNEAGYGSYTSLVEATPFTAPTVPLNFAVVAEDQQAVLSWEAPTDNGGSALTAYVVSYIDELGNTDTQEIPANLLTYTYSSLTNGRSYSFNVQSKTALGLSPPSPVQGAIPFSNPVILSVSVIGDDTLRASIQLYGRKLLKLHGLALDADPSPSELMFKEQDVASEAYTGIVSHDMEFSGLSGAIAKHLFFATGADGVFSNIVSNGM
jgi:hypothetical protein